MTLKLTKAQQDILTLLQHGWELGVSDALVGGRILVQQGGVGKGGESRNIRKSVFDALLAGRYIVRTREHYPTVMYGAATP